MSPTGDEVRISRRFNGPPQSANGGYACGLAGTAVPGDAARVSLRHPPPLEVTLERRHDPDGGVTLLDGETVIAVARAHAPRVEPPRGPTPAQAHTASQGYAGFRHHVFPTCVVCGPARFDDGLRIYAGPLGSDGTVASPWVPESADPLLVWAALDCPTAFACSFDTLGVLAELAVELREPVRPGEPHVVAAWPLGRDGRKHRAASAVYAADGRVLALGEALWIEPRDPAAFTA